MRIFLTILVLIFVRVSLWGQTGSAVLYPGKDSMQMTEDGTALASEIRSLVPEKETTLRGILRKREQDGSIRTFKIISRIEPASDGWNSIYETTDENGNLKERLIIRHSKNSANDYIHEIYDSTGKKKNQSLSLARAFSESDFSIGDLGLEFFHWKKQTILKTEMRKSRVCKVLESIPDKTDNNLGYSKVVSWIDKETLGILIAEAYDISGKKVKQFEVSSFRKDENGIWQIQELEIRNLKTKTRTQLIF